MSYNKVHLEEQRRRMEFFLIIEEHITLRLKKHGFDIKISEPVASSRVNFVYTCRLDGSSAIIKVNFFCRSMLYCYEQFLCLGPRQFRVALQDFERSDLCPEITLEVSGIQLLRQNGIPVPKTILWCSPNIVVYEKLGILTKLPPEATADVLSRIHEISITPGIPSRDIKIQNGLIVINDSNFVNPITVHGVSPLVISLIEKAISRGMRLLHGDLKRSNLLKVASDLYVIDPKLCIGIVEVDIGKLLLRELLTTDQRQTEIVESSLRFLQRYSKVSGLAIEELEATSIVLGLVELQHLLSVPPRQNLDILGDEMPQLYRRKNLVSRLCSDVLQNGKILGIRHISNLIGD